MDNYDISQMLSESHNEIDAYFEDTSLGQCENCATSARPILSMQAQPVVSSTVTVTLIAVDAYSIPLKRIRGNMIRYAI